MGETYPFDVPQSSGFGVFVKYCTPIWERYADYWTPDKTEPLALACLDHWITTAKGQVTALNEIAFDALDNHSRAGAVLYLTENLKLLVDELEDIYCLAQNTLPFDPIMKRWSKQAREDERKSKIEKSPGRPQDLQVAVSRPWNKEVQHGTGKIGA